MKYLRILAVMALSVSLLSSCDFVRSVLGRPTSKDLARIRMEQAAQRKAAIDSLNAARADEELAAADSAEAEVEDVQITQQKTKTTSKQATAKSSTTSKSSAATKPATTAKPSAASKSASAAKAKPVSTAAKRYYVILGAFREYSNADRFMETLSQMNYSPSKFQFNNGFMAVGINGTDNLDEAYQKAAELNGQEFLRGDNPWVYDSQTMKL